MNEENKTKLDNLHADTRMLESRINTLLMDFQREWPGMIVEDISVDLINSGTPTRPEMHILTGTHVKVRLNR